VRPLILAVDTTYEFGSIALARGAETLEEAPLHAPSGYGKVLYPSIAALLERNGVAIRDIDRFAAASGPGSFTGVRVGVTCVKGLAEALGKGALAVSNLEAVARFGRAPLRAAMADARRGEIYAAVYDAAGQIVVPEMVVKVPEWLALLPKDDLEFVSSDFSAFGDALPDLPRVTAPRTLAAAIARIACDREPHDPAALDANYVRRADAEMSWKEQ
jgi:tRNA threonylcarbamoyladenosine biosynthesis protein TsaB